ncbi:MAG: hypothetical protein KC416_09700, partial [Myxococcales bacterium]|nr:hypothetical protein [Myxococcales bacterium]
LLSEWGISLDASVVLELDEGRLSVPPNPIGPFLVNDYGDHRTTESLAKVKSPTLMRLVRSVRPTRDGVHVLLRTTGQAYAETTMGELGGEGQPLRGEGDLDGPVPVAVAAEPGRLSAKAGKDAEGGRVVVVGDSDWLSPDLLRPELANADLIHGFTGWLTQRNTMIAIAPKKISARRLSMTEEGMSDLFVRLLVLIPGAILVLGFATFWSRRS